MDVHAPVVKLSSCIYSLLTSDPNTIPNASCAPPLILPYKQKVKTYHMFLY